jgi:hypothetical protein
VGQRRQDFLSKLTRRRLKWGFFRSIVDLQVAINRFVAETNHDPEPFVWTAPHNHRRRQTRVAEFLFFDCHRQHRIEIKAARIFKTKASAPPPTVSALHDTIGFSRTT